MQPSLKLPKSVVGVMQWGQWGANFSTSEMISFIQKAVEHQLTCFDHADIYGGHTIEEAFGNAFSKSGISRDQVQLITKAGIKYPTEKFPYSIKHYDYGYEYLIQVVDRALKNLQTDYIDVFLLHRPSPLMQAEEVVKAMEQLMVQGKILQFGVSNFTLTQLALMQKYIPIHYNQLEISLTHDNALTDGTLDYLQTFDIQPMAWSPLGTYFKGDNEQNQRIKKVLIELTNKYEVSEDVLLLAWLHQHPSRIITVLGTTKWERILNQSKASNLTLELEEWFALWVASRGEKVP